MQRYITNALYQMGDSSDIILIRSLSGGCINQAFYVETKQTQYFIKLNEKVTHDFFRKEAMGLTLLGQTEEIGVPKVYGEFYFEEQNIALLALEWIEGTKHKKTEEWLGQKLARLHHVYGSAFGLAEDNYIGFFPQKNGWSEDWLSFFRDKRLKVQVNIGQKSGILNGQRQRKLEQLMERLSDWIPSHVKPSLIHGDLWSANWLYGPQGEPYLIDPATYYAHSEIELAYTELFKGFSESFYKAYHEVQPISKTYTERKPIYQLYHLLVHLNTFGEEYFKPIDQVLNRYV
ncbi:fructosamine kinase family protein [Thermoflavimicrobium daqui]|jgi:fructosamine-3-kinase|uniref:Fructosamine kinase n=1 Tax=Thermoflavimicrobium daqui TaxID=2137476 RepID=A0A364K5U6_9BACL|nr:fructosamine kinase family protein [Thermoflavimicrobium daqui]RAL25681.1 fructosamine kinase [Thermoflavimicrobium daqui]